jgi:hypothetical protein
MIFNLGLLFATLGDSFYTKDKAHFCLDLFLIKEEWNISNLKKKIHFHSSFIIDSVIRL